MDDTEKMVEFCQRLIQTPSMPGEEEAVAQVIKNEMEALKYDEVWIDEIGNVIGRIKGRRKGPSVMFTAHMDEVDAGDPSLWEYPPFSGEIAAGYIHGRGASDTKGAIATQVYLPAVLQRPPSADVYVAQVVLEEKGGAGSEHLVNALQPDVVIIGEATKNEICIGHRGRVELAVTAVGKSVHASVPHRGTNPHYAIAEFLLRLKDLPMQSAQGFTATVAPTTYHTDQKSSNVTPGEVIVHLDWRKVSGETNESVLERLNAIIDDRIHLSIVEEKLRSYTGMQLTMKKNRDPYYLDPTTPVVSQAKTALEKALGRQVNVEFWDFVTDAGAFAELGIPVIGFSPCEEEYAHTAIDRVRIDLMEQALRCYPSLVNALQEEQW